MLTNRDSLIIRNMASQATPEKKAEAMFLSILNRMPTAREKEHRQEDHQRAGRERGLRRHDLGVDQHP